MKKTERVKAALDGITLERPPVSLWKHYPAVDQDPLSLAKAHVDFQEKFDLDFIKLTPFDLYCVQDWGCQIEFYCTETKIPVLQQYAIHHITDWSRLKALSPRIGTWGKQLLLAQHVKKLVKPEVPFIQTVYSPLTVARKLVLHPAGL